MPNSIVKTLTIDGVTYDLKDVDSESYAPKASPALTGVPTAPTAANGTDTTQIATTAFVMNAMSSAGQGSVTSVGLSNATNGGLTISGSPITSSGSITVGHTNILTNAQTTQAVYPIKIDKNGHISEYGSAVSIPTKVSDLTNDSGFISSYTETDPVFSASAAADITSLDISNWNGKTSNTGTVTSITLIAGGGISLDTDDTAITTNGSRTISHADTSSQASVTASDRTYIKSVTLDTYGHVTGLSTGTESVTDTNTTYSLSNALSSHKFTETLTAGGSGSGTSTATMEFVAGTGISLTDDTTNKKITIASTVTAPTSAGNATTGVTIDDHSTTTIYGVKSGTNSTTTASKVTVGSHSTDYGVTAAGSGSFTQGSFSGGSFSATVTNHVLSYSFTAATHGADSHTHTAPTLGSKVPTVSASDVTVPIRADSSTTVVTSKTHTVNDSGHTHTLS